MLTRILGKKPAVPQIDVAAVERERASGQAQLVDVREPNEWAAGHVPGSLLIPLGELAVRSGDLDPARPVVMICRSGSRSGVATELLLERGFRDVRNMAGGMIAWAQAGYPIVR